MSSVQNMGFKQKYEIGDRIIYEGGFFRKSGTIQKILNEATVLIQWQDGSYDLKAINAIYYEPPEEEIKRRAAMVRDTWSEQEEARRSGEDGRPYEIPEYQTTSHRKKNYLE